MSDTSTNLQLPYLAPAQAQKHVTVNAGFSRLDVLCQASAISMSTTTQPAAPDDGDLYVLPAGKSGDDWTPALEGDLAWYVDGAWQIATPGEGWRVWVADEGGLFAWSGSEWSAIVPALGAAALSNSYDDLDDRPVHDAEFVRALGALMDDELTDIAAIKGIDQDLHTAATPTFGRTIIQGDQSSLLVVKNDSTGTGDLDAIILCQAKDAGEAGIDFYVDTTRTGAFVVNASSYIIYDVVDNGIEFRSGAGLYTGSPSGGLKGEGTINAESVYDDNTLLSCYVFAQALDGAIDEAEWDARVPNRTRRAETEGDPDMIEVRLHEPMRLFRQRMGTDHDPLTLDGYARHWREKRHLSSMPNEAKFDPEAGMPAGAWVQRLIEAVEIQAVLIEQLNERSKAQQAQIDALGS